MPEVNVRKTSAGTATASTHLLCLLAQKGNCFFLFFNLLLERWEVDFLDSVHGDLERVEELQSRQLLGPLPFLLLCMSLGIRGRLFNLFLELREKSSARSDDY